MSSYIISDRRYYEVASILTTLAKETSSSLYAFKLYDPDMKRWTEPKDIMGYILELKEMNQQSVIEQYSDPDMYVPDAVIDRLQAYERGREIGLEIAHCRCQVLNYIFEFSAFFDEVEYQIENEKFSERAREITTRIMRALVRYADPYKEKRFEKRPFYD